MTLMSEPAGSEGRFPGEIWLSLKTEVQIPVLEGIIQGLNQGLRHCSAEIAFALSTRLSANLQQDNKLAIDSLIQQTRLWSKSSVTVFKYSKPVGDYAKTLTQFYNKYPQYKTLSPAYLMIYMDDQHGMGPEELHALHAHSLQGFKM